MTKLTCTGAGPSGPSGNGLLTGLVSYWPGNEANGDLLDLHGGYTFTDVDNPSSGVGLVYPTARSMDGSADAFVRANTVALKMGNTSWTFAAWFNLSSWPTNLPFEYHMILSNGTTWNGGASMGINFSHGLYCFFFRADNTFVDVHFSTAIAQLNTWYLAGMSWNPDTSTGSLRLDDAAWESTILASHTGYSGNHVIGSNGTFTDYFFDGRLFPFMLWSRQLSEAEWSSLYAAGAGLAYSEFTS